MKYQDAESVTKFIPVASGDFFSVPSVMTDEREEELMIEIAINDKNFVNRHMTI